MGRQLLVHEFGEHQLLSKVLRPPAAVQVRLRPEREGTGTAALPNPDARRAGGKEGTRHSEPVPPVAWTKRNTASHHIFQYRKRIRLTPGIRPR